MSKNEIPTREIVFILLWIPLFWQTANGKRDPRKKAADRTGVTEGEEGRGRETGREIRPYKASPLVSRITFDTIAKPFGHLDIVE